MSRNLHLSSKTGGSIALAQTPTMVTNQAMKLYDAGSTGEAAAAHAVKVYEQFLKEDIQLDPEEIKTIIDHINAFLAYTPGARFWGW